MGAGMTETAVAWVGLPTRVAPAGAASEGVAASDAATRPSEAVAGGSAPCAAGPTVPSTDRGAVASCAALSAELRVKEAVANAMFSLEQVKSSVASASALAEATDASAADASDDVGGAGGMMLSAPRGGAAEATSDGTSTAGGAVPLHGWRGVGVVVVVVDSWVLNEGEVVAGAFVVVQLLALPATT